MTKSRKRKKKSHKWLFSIAFLLIPIGLSIDQAVISKRKNLIPLGVVRVTKYTWHEGGRTTASGYILKDEDSDKICAVGRDWWLKLISSGTKIWLEGEETPCTVLDTMAIKNSKGLLQTRWVDIYHTGVEEALGFGVQKRNVYMEVN